MDYDGWLVMVDDGNGLRSTFFRDPLAADKYMRENPGRLGGMKPTVQGFRFADDSSVA